MADSVKFNLDENEIPKSWYNIVSDLPEPPPPVIHPGTGQPVGPDDLAPLFTMAVIMQEVSAERQIDIPEPVRDIYRQWRPSPLYRAYRLEAALDTPARIYYKYEGVSPAGSHKPNTAVAQAFYCREEGVKRISTETGAGQWGSALALAGSFFGLEIQVFMVRVSYDQKPYRRAFMETFGATCHPSPSNLTEVGKKILAENPDTTGSLGIAISEAVEVAAQRDDTKYSLGSVLNHVLLHQTVVGQEAIRQMELADDYPDVIVGCTGGGSNFAGLSFPFIGRKLRGEQDVLKIADGAMAQAKADGIDVVIFDTAGRLQNQAGLMAGLKKISRVIKKLDPGAPHDCILVLDATVGQNAHSQVEVFGKAVAVSGLVLTKLDGSARGGVLVALAEKFALPIHAVGVGESAADLRPFDPRAYARDLMGLPD